MVVQRKQNRDFWFSIVLNSAPDFLIAAVISSVAEGGWLWFFLTLIGLQVIYFLLCLKNTMWLWILYALRDKRRITRSLVDFLGVNKFPVPQALVDNAEGYLAEVADNETIDIKTRLLAAAELGAISYVRNSFRVQEYFRLSMPYDDAIEEYSRKVSLV